MLCKAGALTHSIIPSPLDGAQISEIDGGGTEGVGGPILGQRGLRVSAGARGELALVSSLLIIHPGSRWRDDRLFGGA